MNDFATELRELIEKWRDHPGTSEDDILNALIDAEEMVMQGDDDDDE
jgi:hypothetical protein